MQKRCHVKVVEPEHAPVRAIDEVVVANAFVGAVAAIQIQYQLPLVRHIALLLLANFTKDRFPKPLDFYKDVLLVKVCICVNRLEKFSDSAPTEDEQSWYHRLLTLLPFVNPVQGALRHQPQRRNLQNGTESHQPRGVRAEPNLVAPHCEGLLVSGYSCICRRSRSPVHKGCCERR